MNKCCLTSEELSRVRELEAELAELLADCKTVEEKNEKCKDAVLTLIYDDRTNPEYFSFCRKSFPRINELTELYQKILDDPREDEAALAYLFREEMTREEKLTALEKAFMTTRSSGYGEAMAGRLSAGVSDAQTERWEKNCDNKYRIERYYDWLKAQND